MKIACLRLRKTNHDKATPLPQHPIPCYPLLRYDSARRRRVLKSQSVAVERIPSDLYICQNIYPLPPLSCMAHCFLHLINWNGHKTNQILII
uniref:Uncharacterized protein n=1 Tax=Arundo donax TaxID=35708 RepID=A0A0A9FLF1_ARUDO